MKKKIVLLLIIFALSGCTHGAVSKVVCEGKMDGKPIVETMIVDGTKVIETEMVITTDLKNKGEMSREEIESMFFERSRDYLVVDGAQYSYEMERDKGVETTILDFEKISLDRVYNVDLLDSLNSDFMDINLKKEKYKINGGICETKSGLFR